MLQKKTGRGHVSHGPQISNIEFSDGNILKKRDILSGKNISGKTKERQYPKQKNKFCDKTILPVVAITKYVSSYQGSCFATGYKLDLQ